MFLILLVAEVIVSLVISWYIVRALNQPIEKILNRIIADETSRAWLKYVKFAIYVVGILGGVRVREKDINEYGLRMMERGYADFEFRMSLLWPLALEIFATIIGALRDIFWFLTYFFIAAAIAFIIVKVTELEKSKSVDPQDRA